MFSGILTKKVLVPALVGAGLCLLLLRSAFFVRSGFLTLFFLVPPGVVAYRCDYRAVWASAVLAALGNVVLVAATTAALGIPLSATFWDLLYFTAMVCLFAWITAPPPGVSERLSPLWRLMAASCAGALVFAGLFLKAVSTPGFSEYVNAMLERLVDVYRSAGSDVVQNALLESLTVETVIKTMKSIILRGGSLVSSVFIFFVSRRLSLAIARFSLRKSGRSPGADSLAAAHVPPAIIWIFSAALLLVVLSRIAKFEIPEIILWNVLILCIILYFAQGLGILQFFLSKPAVPPSLRFLLTLLFVLLLFSPVLNALLLGIIVLVGIAENWVPFRAPRQNGPPSTPEAGDGES